MFSQSDRASDTVARPQKKGGAVFAYKIARSLHLVAMAMFLGGSLGHLGLGLLPGVKDSGEAILLWRQAAEMLTRSLTLPGFGLLTVTGIFMILRSGGLANRRWLVLHLLLALCIAAVSFALVMPAGAQLLDVARRLRQGTGSAQVFDALLGRELIFAAFSTLLAITAIFVASLKPRLGVGEPRKQRRE